MNQKLTIATRRSELALFQAERVAKKLAVFGLSSEISPITTEGDINLIDSLAKMGGKGVFIKELEVALMESRADIAVHSMKDVPVQLPAGFQIPCYLKRDSPSDCLVIPKVPSSAVGKIITKEFTELSCVNTKWLKGMPDDFRLATSSLRRSSQILKIKPKQSMVPVRGNINTRLNKLKAGEFDGLVLARAGIDRLLSKGQSSEFHSFFNQHFIVHDFDHALMLPAIAQGVIGIECTNQPTQFIETLKLMDDWNSRVEVDCERVINSKLGGSCVSTLAAFAQYQNQQITITTRVLSPDGGEGLEYQESLRFNANESKAKIYELALNLAAEIAQKMESQGAKKYLG